MKKSFGKMISALLCVIMATGALGFGTVVHAAGGLPAVDFSAPVPVAQPWHNQAFAGDPAGFRPDRVPTELTLDNQGDNATITYTIATFAVANGAAPTQAQVDSVPAPDKMSTDYTAPIQLTGANAITATQAVVIKAYAYTAGTNADDSPIATWVGFQRVWVLTDVKTLQDGSPNDFRAKVATTWTDSVLDKVINEMTDAEVEPMLGGSQNGQIANSMPNPKYPTVAAGGALADVRLNSNATGTDFGISRLCIPTTEMSDGPAGVRNGQNTTAWVVATALASSWDTDVQRMFAEGVANDCKWFGYDFMLAPAFDIHRSPIGGRNFEYYSEDPIVAGKNAVMYTQTLGKQDVGVSLKHYVANDQENNRNNYNSIVAERPLREINLLPFEMAVEQADPTCIMTSYNQLNGVHTTLNPWLNNQLPFDEWGYQGFTQTDWGNTWNQSAIVARLDQHQSTASASVVTPFLTYENAASNTGNVPNITDATYSARRAIVNRNIKDILHSVIKMPIFNGDYDGLSNTITSARHTNYYTEDGSPQKANQTLNRELSGKTMILLKNDSVNGAPVLPLAAGKSISMVYSSVCGTSTTGNTDFVVQGGGSGAVTWSKEGVNGAAAGSTPTIREAMIADGYTVPNYAMETTATASAMPNWASATDIGMMIISRNSSEGSDVTTANFDLNTNEKNIIGAMSSAFHAAGKPFIVLINMGGNCNTQEIRSDADAILYISDPGQQGGQATADVLTGVVNPSGKTVDTWPIGYNDTVPMLAESYFSSQIDPSHNGFTWAATSSYVTVLYDEYTLMGYRFFDTIAAIDPTFKASDHVAFPFGFGLSYTTFAYSNLKLSSDTFNDMNDDATVTATVTVTNTGTVPGRTAVEMYLGASTFKEEFRPVRELKDYAMSNVLDPGKSQDVTFTINKKDLCYFDDGTNFWKPWNVKVNGTAVGSAVIPTSDAQYAAYANVTPAYTDLTLNYEKTSLNGVNAYTTYNGFYGEGGHTTGWRVDDGTKFTVQIGPDSSTADLLAYGTSGEFEYGPVAAISAPTMLDTDKDQLVYSIGVKDVENANAIEIQAQFDASKLDLVGSALQPALPANWQVVFENFDASTGIYTAFLSAMKGATLNATDLTNILNVTFAANAGVAFNDVIAASLSYVNVITQGTNTNYKVSALLDPDSASSTVTNHLRWDITDGNDGGPDGQLAPEDLALIIDTYYGASSADAGWNVPISAYLPAPSLFDVDGNGIVNIVDIQTIASYIF